MTCTTQSAASRFASRATLASLLLFALAFAGACSGKSPAQPSPLPGKSVETYRVRPPDQLTISILPEPVIERTVTVRPDGMISVDLLGDVPVAGRTTEEISADIQSRISRYKRDASVTVALAVSRSTEITVLGEVFNPSVFPLERETRVIEAIGAVGGLTNFAKRKEIRVIRSGDSSTDVYFVNVEAIRNGDLSTNIFLEGGDIVYAPPTGTATVGYAISSLLFPFQQLLGFGTSVSTRVVTGR